MPTDISRRRDAGQLSKGAIRAQRAQARAKQMRQNLLGSNLLNMSLYNAAAQGRGIPSHPGALHHLGYDMAQDTYMPVGYDLDGRPVAYNQQGMYAGQMDGGDMYRLPPIDGVQGYDAAWAGQAGSDYWAAGAQGAQGYVEGYYHPVAAAGPSDFTQGVAHPAQGPHGEYPLASMGPGNASGSGSGTGMGMGVNASALVDKQVDPRLNDWARDGQQTPSGHVLFNERLFDGALGSAGIPSLGDSARDDGLAGFEEAMAQASDMPQW